MLICLQDDCIKLDSENPINVCRSKHWCNLLIYQRFEALFFQAHLWRRLDFIHHKAKLGHKPHQFPRHFGYQITSHLINLPVSCHHKASYSLPSPNNMQHVCQKPLWNCVFQISNDQTVLLSRTLEDIVSRYLSKYISFIEFLKLFQLP